MLPISWKFPGNKPFPTTLKKPEQVQPAEDRTESEFFLEKPSLPLGHLDSDETELKKKKAQILIEFPTVMELS